MLSVVVAGVKTYSLIHGLGSTSINTIINTVTFTSNSICKTLDYMARSDNIYVQDMSAKLEEIDLEFNVSIIEELMKEISDKNIDSTTFKKAIAGVNNILNKIHKELTEIENSIEYHNAKYFSTWRTFDCNFTIDNIIKHKNILDMRYKILVDLLKINL